MAEKPKQLPKLFTRADILPETVNEEERTFEIIWSTGAVVHRNRFWSEPFRESLSLEKRHVRLERLNGGAPFLDAHGSWSTSDVIGKIVEGSAKVDGKEGRAKVKFSDRNEKIRGLWQDIKAGILKNTSVGYRVYKYRDVTESDDKTKHLRAIDWEPMEASLVPIGADPGAQVRSDQEELFTVTIEQGETRAMAKEIDDKNKPATPAQAPPVVEPKTDGTTRAEPPKQEPPKVDEAKIRQEAAQVERKRISEIERACQVAKMDGDFVRKLVDDGVLIDQARAMIFDRLAEVSDQGEIKNHVRVEQTGLDHTVTRRDAIESALLNRFDSKNELLEAGREYRQMSLIDLARRSLDWAGFGVVGVGKSDIAIRALSTSDFPNILANVLNKTLRDAYIQTPQTFMPFVNGVSLPDFKNVQRTGFGESPKLLRVYEDGEITYGSIVEAAETYQLATYARGIVITRVAVINDDLNAFMRIGRGFGQQVKHLESDLVWGVITTNAAMGDTVALFHADHGNLAGAAAISETTLTAAVLAMMSQKGLDAETFIQIIPSYLVVPVALRTIAKRFLATNIQATKEADVNVFSGEFNLVTEIRLDANSATKWYLFSDVANTADMIELAKLDGQSEPQLLQRPPSGVDGMKIEVVYDVAAKAIDHRPFYRNG